MVFCWPGELRGAQWSEFDLDAAEWRIPAVRRKLRKHAKENPRTPPHVVPLSWKAVAVLRELHALTGTATLVFPGVRDRKRPMSENTVNAALHSRPRALVVAQRPDESDREQDTYSNRASPGTVGARDDDSSLARLSLSCGSAR